MAPDPDSPPDSGFAITSVADPDPGSGAFFDPWIRDPGWVKKSRSGSWMSIPDHISESLETIFGLKILIFFMRIQIWDPELFLTLDPDLGHGTGGRTFTFFVGIRIRIVNAYTDPGEINQCRSM